MKERPELAVATNLSRGLPKRPSLLNEAPQDPGDQFVRHGLGWMTALARVELGAMLAGFSQVKRPFQQMAPVLYDTREYNELLLDGARTHYWALSNDPRLQKALKQRVEQVYKAVLSYSRRLVIARGMLRAARSVGVPYSLAQHREMQYWRQAMDETQSVLVDRIQSILGAKFVSMSSTSGREYANACGALLNAERRELAAGTAKVESLQP